MNRLGTVCLKDPPGIAVVKVPTRSRSGSVEGEKPWLLSGKVKLPSRVTVPRAGSMAMAMIVNEMNGRV
jgi:hypothetical protein